MSCWVVPAVAAGLWGMSVEQVMSLIAGGQVPSKHDYHFLVVDVAPGSPRLPAATGGASDGNDHDADDEGGGEFDGERALCVRPGEAAVADATDTECSWVRVRRRVARQRRRPVA